MKIETINSKSVMNVGLININYKLEPQLQVVKPNADVLIYFDNNDLDNILDNYIRDNDTLTILTYSFINDNPRKSIDFKDQLDKRGIRLQSVLESTVEYSKAMGQLMFELSVGLYEFSKFILDNRLKDHEEGK